MSKRSAAVLLVAALIIAFLFLRNEPQVPPAPAYVIPKVEELTVTKSPPPPDPVRGPVITQPVSSHGLPPLDEQEVAKRRSLAKNYLSSGYGASRAFHAEYERYSTDLKTLGWEPSESWMEFKLEN